jgi:hypothetical protein
MDEFHQNAFKIKLASAAKALGVTPAKIVSLRFPKSDTSNLSSYHLIGSLEKKFGFKHSHIDNAFRGNGHLLTKNKSKFVVVEHESGGLEILYIAGSIASIIAVIPMVLQGWNAVQRFANPKNMLIDVQARGLDETGNVQELDVSNLALATAILVEDEFQRVNGQIEGQLRRIDALEKRLAGIEDKLKSSIRAKHTKRK